MCVTLQICSVHGFVGLCALHIVLMFGTIAPIKCPMGDLEKCQLINSLFNFQAHYLHPLQRSNLATTAASPGRPAEAQGSPENHGLRGTLLYHTRNHIGLYLKTSHNFTPQNMPRICLCGPWHFFRFRDFLVQPFASVLWRQLNVMSLGNELKSAQKRVFLVLF